MITRLLMKAPANKLIEQIQPATINTSNSDIYITKPRYSYTITSAEEVNPTSPKEFATLLRSLSPNHTLMYGLFKSEALQNNLIKRTKVNIRGIDNPFIAFDCDYIINDKYLTIELLSQLDPQWKKVGYVINNSSSNLCFYPKNKQNPYLLNPYKRKFWVQFDTKNQEEIKEYINILYVRAILNNLYFIKSKRIVTIFDEKVFSPERIFFETPPTIIYKQPFSFNEKLFHNSNITYKQGAPLSLAKVKPLTTEEINSYTSLIYQLKRTIKVTDSRNSTTTNRTTTTYIPIIDKVYLTDTYLYTVRGKKKKYHTDDIILDYLLHKKTIDDYFRDPRHPDQALNKAKLFFNKQNIILHSFRHGECNFQLFLSDKATLQHLSDLKELNIDLSGFLNDPSLISKRFNYLTHYIPKIQQNLYNNKLFLVHTPTLGSNSVIGFTNPTNSDYKIIPANTNFFQKSAIGNLTIPISHINNLILNSIPKVSAIGLKFPDDSNTISLGDDLISLITNTSDTYPKLELWRGFAVTSNKSKTTHNSLPPSTYQTTPFYKLLTAIAPNSDDRKWLEMWLANLIQHPFDTQVRLGVIIKGQKGTGKSLFQRLIGSWLHPSNVSNIQRADALIGKFNSHLANKLLVIGEEISLHSKNNKEVIEYIKNLTTSSTLTIEAKGKNSYEIPNFLRLLLSTNNSNTYIQQNDDRRWLIYNMESTYKGNMDFFQSLIKWWDNGGKEITFNHYKNYKYDLNTYQLSTITREGIKELATNLYGIEEWIFQYLISPQTTDLYSTKQAYITYSTTLLNPLPYTKFKLFCATKGIDFSKKEAVKKWFINTYLFGDESKFEFLYNYVK